MSRKKILSVILIICILFCISFVLMIKNIYVQDDYTKDLTKDEKELVLDIIENVSFGKDIKNTISAKKVYSDFISIENYQYTSKIYKMMNESNQMLNELDSSFVDVWNKDYTIEDILKSYCGSEFIEFENAYLLGDDKHEEYSEKMSETTYLAVLKQISDFKYSAALKSLDTILDTYKFTESYNYKLANVYHDLQILNTANELDDVDVLKKLYDPAVYTIETMRLFVTERYDIVEDKNSPALYDSTIIDVNNVEWITVSTDTENYKDFYKKIFDFYLGTDAPHDSLKIAKITFTSHDDTFDAYVAILNDKSCKFYSIISNSGKTYTSLFDQNLKDIQSLEDTY